MARIQTLLTVLLISYAVCTSGCSNNSTQIQVIHRIAQMEKEKGWRILVSDGNLYFFTAQTKSMVRLDSKLHDEKSSHNRASINASGTTLALADDWKRLTVLNLTDQKADVLVTLPYLDDAQ